MTSLTALDAPTHATPAPQYEQCGYLLVRRVFSRAECAAFREEADRLAQWRAMIRPDNLRTELWERDGRRRVNKYDPVIDVSPTFAAVAADPRLLDVLQTLFGEPARLFKDKLIFKMPGHQGFGPHQDHTWYRVFPATLIAVMVNIDGADAANGALEVAAGCHGMLNPVPEHEVRDLTPDECPAEHHWRTLTTGEGDVIFFDGRLPHRSAPNTSDRPRRTLYLTYTPGRYGDLYARYYTFRRDLLLRDNGPSRGNFYVGREFRASADYVPPIPGVTPAREACG
jgi:2-aminoethylphosphonate dioxygenase